MPSDERFYMAFGELTAAFAHMEADIRRFISGLAFRSDPTIAGAFLDSSQLAANLNTLRKLARRFWNEQTRIDALASSVERIKSQRNLFIHGLWNPASFGQPDGAAEVLDLKTAYEAEPTTKKWSYGDTQRFSLAQFVSIHAQVREIIEEIENLMDSLEDGEEIQFGGHSGAQYSWRPVTITDE